MGPGALSRRGFWQNEFLFAPAWHIAGGTDQVQKNVCAERVLGMPRDEGTRAHLRDDLARVYTELKSLELLNARVVTKLGRGQMPTAESSVMKLALARVMTRAADTAMKAMGPGALLRRGFWQNEFLFAPAWHIAGGTDQVQKNVCAERVLGLPRDPHDTKNVPFDQLPKS